MRAAARTTDHSATAEPSVHHQVWRRLTKLGSVISYKEDILLRTVGRDRHSILFKQRVTKGLWVTQISRWAESQYRRTDPDPWECSPFNFHSPVTVDFTSRKLLCLCLHFRYHFFGADDSSNVLLI